MSWWKTALYDTCSLVTLDKLYQDRSSLSRCFPRKVLALDQSFLDGHMREDIAARMKLRVQTCSPPNLTTLANLLSASGLSRVFSDMDKLVYATAVHSDLAVVTSNKGLAKAVRRRGLEVGNIALILQELVRNRKLKASVVERMLQDLADRKNYLLGIPNPAWEDLKAHTFPD